jgi:hypothetical protein
MANADPHSIAQEDGQPESPSMNCNAAGEPPRNHTADAQAAQGQAHAQALVSGEADAAPQPAGDGHDDRSGLERAETIVDHLAARASSLFMVWGRKFLRFTSRARESAQDFWAEVQDFRHGRKP